MQAKQRYHNGMVILKAPPQFLDHYKGGEPGQRPIKWNLLSVFLGRSEAEQTVCYFGCLAQTDDGRKSTIQCFAELSQETKDTQEDFSSAFPNQMWSISTYNQGTVEIPDTILLSPSIMSSFILQEIIYMSMQMFLMTWTLTSLCKDDFAYNHLTGFFFFFKTIGTEFSVCGSQVNTELLSLSLCQSNIQP